MNYEFPVINHINDVLPSIAGRDEFCVYKKDGYTLVNYNVVFSDSFPDPCSAPNEETKKLYALRRECRGLLFHSNGKVLSRAFHKFFNISEKEETQPNKLNFDKEYQILEKVDGSLLRFHHLNGVLYGFTKAGITDIANDALLFATKNIRDFELFIQDMEKLGATALFEWMSRSNRVVIDHPKDRLVLTAIRYNDTGKYMKNIAKVAEEYGLECIHSFSNFIDFSMWIDKVQKEKDIEGYVIRFDSGHMLKIKNEWYLQIHRAKDKLSEEKNIIEMILTNTIDDVIPHLPEVDRHRLEIYQKNLYESINIMTTYVDSFIYNVKLAMTDVPDNQKKKIFALDFIPKFEFDKNVAFKVFDGKNAFDEIVAYILKNTSTRTKVENIRTILEFDRWNETNVE